MKNRLHSPETDRFSEINIDQKSIDVQLLIYAKFKNNSTKNLFGDSWLFSAKGLINYASADKSRKTKKNKKFKKIP